MRRSVSAAFACDMQRAQQTVHKQRSHTTASLRHTLTAAGGGEHATLSRIGSRRDADGRNEPCDVPFALGPQGRGPTCVVRWHSCNMCRCVEPARILGLLRLSADAPLVGMWLPSQGLRACPFTRARAHALPIWRAIARGPCMVATQAEELRRHAVRRLRRVMGDDHPLTLAVVNHWANSTILAHQGASPPA